MGRYLALSGCLWGLIALLHLLRLLQGWPATVATWSLPLWVSLIGVAVPGSLAVWAFRLGRVPRRSPLAGPSN